MQVILERRAEVALRSLADAERTKVARAFAKLSELDQHGLSRHLLVHRLSGLPVQLYSYRVSDILRIVFSVQSDRIVIQDITNFDRLKHLTGGLG